MSPMSASLWRSSQWLAPRPGRRAVIATNNIIRPVSLCRAFALEPLGFTRCVASVLRLKFVG
jgi:hypothetical protein